jgi:hypothetical protein
MYMAKLWYQVEHSNYGAGLYAWKGRSNQIIFKAAVAL